eukprot:UN01318
MCTILNDCKLKTYNICCCCCCCCCCWRTKKKKFDLFVCLFCSYVDVQDCLNGRKGRE